MSTFQGKNTPGFLVLLNKKAFTSWFPLT